MELKILNKKIRMVVEKTNTGFSAYSEEYPIFTTASQMPDLLNNATEAANLYFNESGHLIDKNSIKFELDFKQFFQFYRVINSKFLAIKIGMNPALLSQYVTGNKKPSLKQTEKILNGIQSIGRELAEIKLIYK
jgi:hypothetical protein